VLARQLAGHPVPHDVGLRIAVQQQHRRPAAAAAQVDHRLPRVDVLGLEAREHR
jgi:hypothetical protein